MGIYGAFVNLQRERKWRALRSVGRSFLPESTVNLQLFRDSEAHPKHQVSLPLDDVPRQRDMGKDR